jgi:tRNA threonylcarbamoyladenosine modification (KEOPS) complex  Pcc1 subunit
MINCEITLKKNLDEIYKLFLPEIKQAKTKRAEYTLEKTNKSLRFVIEAKDIKSFKAFVNSIIKIIETYNKVAVLKNGKIK